MKYLLYILMMILMITPVLSATDYVYCHNGTQFIQITSGRDIVGPMYEEGIYWNLDNESTTTVGNDIPLGGLFNGTSGVVFIIIIAGLFYVITKKIIIGGNK